MSCRLFRWFVCIVCAGALSASAFAQAQSSSSSSSAKQTKTAPHAEAGIDPGAVSNGVYRNKTLALSCQVPSGWVLRTDELKARQEGAEQQAPEQQMSDKDKPAAAPASSTGARVLLAAFSRPPEAKAEDVNGSILIAVENQSSYPGLEDAAQYFGPLTEVAKAQGFTVDEEPYEIAVGTKKVVRGDFHKDVGSRVMHQSTLALLSHGYAVSITLIGGTEDEIEERIDGLTFIAGKN